MSRYETGPSKSFPTLSGGGATPVRLGRYDLINRIATGGMAEIFLAVEKGVQGLERLVIVKRILPHLAQHQAFIDMFLQEARIVARLNHPNIVQIHELGEQDESFYIVMEYVDGSSFRELMRSAAKAKADLPMPVALSLVAQACAGAHAAHELSDPSGKSLGLVHRDISPHNLMVTGAGHVKLLDFGIAKATEIALDEKTRTGALKGKVHYMSPEQCRQEPLDRRSDIFALGIVLWELLTARRLFKRDSELETMQAIVSGEVWDPRDFREDVPGAVVLACMRAIKTERDDRYKTADEMRRALMDAASVLNLSAQPDEVAPFVEEVLGDQQRAMTESVTDALERTQAAFVDDGAEATVLDRPAIAPREGTASGTRDSTSETLPSAIGGAAVSGLLDRVETKRYGVASVFALVAVLVGLALGLGLYWARQSAPVVSGAPITIGWPPTVDEVTLASDLEPFRVYLEEKTHRPIRFKFTASYGELSDLLVAGGLDFASLPPFIFLQTVQREPNIQLLGVNLQGGAAGNDGVLLVAEKLGVQRIEDLKGKTWCFSDEDSTTGYALPRALLVRHGIDTARDLKKVKTDNHEKTLRAILAGECDFGGTYSGNYLSAEAKGINVSRLRQLAITGRSPNDAIVGRASLAPKEVELMKQALLGFSAQDAFGIPMLGIASRISGFTAAKLSDWDDLRQALVLSQALPPANHPPANQPPANHPPAGHAGARAVDGGTSEHGAKDGSVNGRPSKEGASAAEATSTRGDTIIKPVKRRGKRKRRRR